MTNPVLGGLVKHAAFPVGVVLGLVGIFKDKSKWLAAGATIAAAVLTVLAFR